MINSHPTDFVQSFTNERLAILANALLEQCYDTDEDLQSMYDSNYSIGCTRFDRQKNCLLEMAPEHEWLTVADASNRLVMEIDKVPFRFTNDDHLSPKKKTVFEVSDSEASQIAKSSIGIQVELNLNEPNQGEMLETPAKWRFYVDMIETIDGAREYEIFFVGLNIFNKPACIWQLSEQTSSYIYSVDNKKPETVKTRKPKTTLPNISDKHTKNTDKK